ncbi:MAG: hypothetical protein IPN49_17125 [Saprospiraceae bacterium]|nr:hypothetical protein [Saprospiraceae bacterium]
MKSLWKSTKKIDGKVLPRLSKSDRKAADAKLLETRRNDERLKIFPAGKSEWY